MRKFRIGAGPLVALVVFTLGAGYAVLTGLDQSATEMEIRSSLPLARI